MNQTHPFTLHGKCPCRIGADAVSRAVEIFKASGSVEAFALEMERQRVIGKRIWYDRSENTLFIAKVYACDSGGGCAGNKSPIGQRCHCDHYNHSGSLQPRHFCKCGAEFYRPMFAPLFGEHVLIEPYNTVLSGDEECILAVRIGEVEDANDDF